MRPEKSFRVYIMSNTHRGVLYTGMTSDIVARVGKHRSGTYGGFTDRYGLKRLVWHRRFGGAEAAISFEKRLKRWRREWKFALIEEINPGWDDLWLEFFKVDGVDHG